LDAKKRLLPVGRNIVNKDHAATPQNGSLYSTQKYVRVFLGSVLGQKKLKILFMSVKKFFYRHKS
jgi:hypothetical protein